METMAQRNARWLSWGEGDAGGGTGAPRPHARPRGRRPGHPPGLYLVYATVLIL